jgi:hypothetical protein
MLGIVAHDRSAFVPPEDFYETGFLECREEAGVG